MIDRFGNELDITEIFEESELSTKDRNKLDDSDFGIPELRKYPLTDESHVLQAVRFFNKAPDEYKPELARNIVKRAKELDMEWENWDVLKPYLDKPVKESYDPDPDSASGTSDFDECINDDEYYGEADQALMNQIQKNEDNIPLFQLRTYAKNHLSKRSVAGTTELIFKIGREYTGNNSFEKRCHEYFLNLICEIDKCIKKSGDKISAVKKPKWFFYERKIKQLFNLIGVDYAKDRVLSYISGNRGIISFEEKESIKYTYDPNTDILIHRSRHSNINMLIPSHESRDGIVYPRPRIYCYLEQRADFRLAAQDNGQYGDNVYEIVIPKSITVFRDMEYGKPHDNNKYAKEVFINTNVPLKAKPITYDNTSDQINQQQTTNNTSPPPIQESFDEMFGEKVSLKNMYQESSTDMMKVNDLECDELYFGSDTKYPVEIDLNRPLFVTPLKGIASIFVGRADLKGIIPKGSYNLDYKEWRLPDKELMKPLKTVHVYVEGYPDLKEQEITLKGYIHCIPFKYYKDNIYRYPWMSKGVEYLIANTENMKVEFTRIIECEVKYIVKGVPSDNPKYGPDLKGYLELAKHIAKKISIQVKNDSKPPTGNQNCQLCTWCAEAQFRGMKVLPRPVYSPRDPVFKIVGENIVHQPRCISLKQGYDDFLDHLMDVDTTFARWYCHVNWKGSTGGHEFMLLKIDKKFYIMDPQSGKVETLDDTHKYFEDINWDNSYICRFDNKAFNHELLEKTNDPSKTLPWDPKKDIPYMVKHGMCTKEEAEKELKKMETNLFTSELKKALNQTHIQESASDPMTIIPKDLRDWLKKGDYSSLEKDDAYYYVEGHPVEEFWRDPEFARSAFYLDDKNDPSYNSIVFSDDNGNGLIYDPTDGWYYYLYHDWTEDDTGFLHRERLSSKSWTQIIDPTHSKSIKDSDEKRSEISKELTHLKANPIYDDIEYGATNSHFGKGFFKSDCSAMEKRWNAIGHEWCNAVEDFADKYKFPELSEAIDIFANKTMSLFVPTIGSHGYDIEAYKEGAKNVIKAFQDVEKSLKESHIQEGAWDDIRNGVNPWSDKLIFHISPEGHLDGQVFKPRVPEYLDKYDPSQTNFEDVDNPRICFSTSIEGALNAILVNIGRWKTAEKLNNWYVYIPEKPLKNYKHSTNKNIIEDKKVFDANLTKEIWIEEPVRLKQYGIIRIDQVKSVARRKTVPTINGEKGDRNYYSFKWHWLVRPSVLKNIPYDYSPIAVCNNMLDDISKYKYGLGMNGSTHSVSSKEYNEKYRLESPEEFEKNGGGICYDFVEWQAGYLEAYGYTCRKFYISTDTEDMDTHTFILVDDGKGGFIYPEAAFKPMEGVYVVKSPEEAALKVMGHIFDINDNDEKYDEIKYYVWEYKDHPAYGSTIKECMEYFSKGEPFYEGIAKNKKE